MAESLVTLGKSLTDTTEQILAFQQRHGIMQRNKELHLRLGDWDREKDIFHTAVMDYSPIMDYYEPPALGYDYRDHRTHTQGIDLSVPARGHPIRNTMLSIVNHVFSQFGVSGSYSPHGMAEALVLTLMDAGCGYPMPVSAEYIYGSRMPRYVPEPVKPSGTPQERWHKNIVRLVAEGKITEAGRLIDKHPEWKDEAMKYSLPVDASEQRNDIRQRVQAKP